MEEREGEREEGEGSDKRRERGSEEFIWFCFNIFGERIGFLLFNLIKP